MRDTLVVSLFNIIDMFFIKSSKSNGYWQDNEAGARIYF